MKNEIYYTVDSHIENLTWASKYDLDTDLVVPLFQWLNKIHVCFVAVDRYLYAIGGMIELVDLECEVEVAY